MAPTSNSSLVDTLRQLQLLRPKQLDELTTLQSCFQDAESLATEMLNRGWLTSYQAALLLQGEGDELVIGSYIVLDHLGHGGMGDVFKARHRKMDRIVALKLIRKERMDSPNIVKRFQREVRAVAALAHPNIVHAFDADNIDGKHLLVMEYIEGANDLAKFVKRNGPLPVWQACDLIRQTALGLQHAAERGLVHRDIKPANLLLAADGQTVKVLDMGLSRLDSGAEDDKSSTTQMGSVIGTPDYMAPEQVLERNAVDIRADIYSLGCTFYYLLAGRVPFPGGNLLQKIEKHQSEEPDAIEPLRPDVPSGVASVLRKMMAKMPGDRYQAPVEVAEALLRFCEPTARDKVKVKGAEAATTVGEVRDETVSYKSVHVQSTRRSLTSRAAASLILIGLATTSYVLLTQSRAKVVIPPLETMALGQAKGQTNEQKEVERVSSFSNSVGMKFVWISPGTFWMGCPRLETGWKPEQVEHQVTLSKGFYMSIHEVTMEQWHTVVGDNNSPSQDEMNLPVDNVSWEDCQLFARRLSEKEGQAYRLPTEAEWEYACRAGTRSEFAFGTDISTDLANYGDFRKKATPVGTFPPNAWGLCDMHGNLSEWTADWFEPYPVTDAVDPTGPEKGRRRVLRGGAFDSPEVFVRSAHRASGIPTLRYDGLGFRLVRDAPP